MDATHCKATNRLGQPCRVSPRLVGASGYCLRHDPDPATVARRMAYSLRGSAQTKARRLGMKKVWDDELPVLKTMADAEQAAALLFRFVATGRMHTSTCNSAVRAIDAFRSVHAARNAEQRIAQLEEQIAALRKSNGNGKHK